MDDIYADYYLCFLNFGMSESKFSYSFSHEVIVILVNEKKRQLSS